MVRRCALVLMVVVGACRGVDAPARAGAEVSPDAGKPAVEERVAWNGEGPLEVVFTDFHFELGGIQVVAIADDGRVRDLFARSEIVAVTSFCADAGPGGSEVCADLVKRGESRVGTTTWFVAEYTLDPAARDELRAKVVAAKLETLRDRYAEPNLEDGTTRTYSVVTRAGARRISTYSGRDPVDPAGLRLASARSRPSFGGSKTATPPSAPEPVSRRRPTTRASMPSPRGRAPGAPRRPHRSRRSAAYLGKLGVRSGATK